jgi:hypothetical protein
MLDHDGGGGHTGGTDWYGHDVPSMWSMLESQKTDEHWTHVSGWRKTFELTSTHLSRLKEYRDKLAEAWPPKPGTAAEAYVTRLDGLIDHVQQTYDVAVANYAAAGGAIGAISTSRNELKQVYDEYVAKAQQKQEYEDLVASQAASQLPGTTLPPPPVTDADIERLNAKARSIMYGLSGELVQAQVRLQQPPPPATPTPTPTKVERGSIDSDAYGGGRTPPVIPPIVPVPRSSSSASVGSGIDLGGSSGPDMEAIRAQPAPGPSAPVVGPVLGGAGPIAPPAAPVAPAVITPSTPPAGSGIGLTPFLPVAPGTTPRAGSHPRAGGIGGLPGSSTTPPAGSTAKPGGLPGPRPMPPGGLIGGTPGAGFAQPAPGQARPRINPIGGVIGGGGGTPPSGAAPRPVNGSGARPISGVTAVGGPAHRSVAAGGRGSTQLPIASGGRARLIGAVGSGGPASDALGRGSPTGIATSGAQPHGAAAAAQPKVHRDEERARRWDPDNPWETDEGVAPIVTPPREAGRIDPGPAIGFDR